MIQYRRPKDKARLLAILFILGLVLFIASLLPSSRAAIVRALSLGDENAWLEMVDSTNQLYTEYPLTRLSGKLIQFGAVNASGCENSGLDGDGVATDCGVLAAQPKANEWQNQFNAAILDASEDTRIPPRLLKNLFAWESQFWPETIFVNTFEYGLGHITIYGADSALRWDSALYQEVCAASFSDEYCKKEYGDQPESFRNSLQGVFVQRLNADCSGCTYRLDLDKAADSIPLIGRTLQANAAYVRYALKVFTGKDAADVVGEADLWRFILTSYNAGPGCFRNALSSTYYRGLPLTWSNLQGYLEPACRGAIPYVEFISQTDAYHPENDPALWPTATPESEPTPTPVPPVIAEPHVEDEIVVRIKPENLEDALETLAGLNISPDQVSEPIDKLGTRVIQVEAETLTDVLNSLQSDPIITNAEPNYEVSAAALPPGYPNDPLYPSQPNLIAAEVYAAWDTLSIADNPGIPVVVAVLDTGVDGTHPELTGAIWNNAGETACANGLDDDYNGRIDDCAGWDFVNRDNLPADDHAHGTEMAGVIGAVTNNAIGIAGIAPNARMMPVKVLASTGIGTHAWAAEGIYYAANMGARIIYIGFAGSGNSDVLRNAIAFALSKGIIIIAPAGNDSGATITNYPAGYPGVISVSATSNTGTIAPFSTRSNTISLAAPGVDILSTAPGNTYQTTSGTSLAAAHVSGAAVLLAGQPRFLNQPDLLLTALLGSALDQGPVGRDSIYGFGLLRANQAITYAISAATVNITTPADSAVFAQGQTITFAGSAADSLGVDISSLLVWTSNIDGPIGSGATFSVSDLTPGAHAVTASAAGGTAKVNIRVLEDLGPHGEFGVDSTNCYTCHATHSDGTLNPASAYSSNAYCVSCHDGKRARAVSTHGNIASQTFFEKQEQNFEMLCIQCHDPHGAGANLFVVRDNFVLGTLPNNFHSMYTQPAAITFTTFTPGTMNGMCVYCHEDANNPGFPMASHDGGDTHNDVGDQTNEYCTFCHFHDLDGNPATSDGFMPASPVPVSRQGNPETSPRTAATAVPQ